MIHRIILLILIGMYYTIPIRGAGFLSGHINSPQFKIDSAQRLYEKNHRYLINQDMLAISLKIGLIKMLEGDSEEGLGAFAAFGNAGFKDGYFLLGWFCAYGYGIPQNDQIANKYFELSGRAHEYSAQDVSRLSEAEFVAATQNMIDQLDRIVNAQLNLMNTNPAPLRNSRSTPSNSTPRQSNRDCPICHGTGTCQTCFGDGIADSPYTGGWMVCPNCKNDTGKCSICHGSGIVR